MKVKGVPGPLGLFCTASLVSALTLSVQSSIGYSQYDPGSRAGLSVIPIVTASIEEDAPVHPAVSGVVAVSHIVPIVTPRERDIATAAAPAHVSHAVSEEASRLVVRVKKGDTLMDILTKSGVAADDAEQAISSLKDVFNPRDLKTGQEVTLQFGQAETLAALEAGSEDSGSTFMSVKLRPAAGREVAVHRDASGEFAASDVQKALRPILYRSAGVIQSSLSEATDKAGLPRKVLQDVISAFSYDVDFQRDIQPGDSFEVLYERMADDEGNSVDTGKVEFAQMVLSGQRISLYRYTTKDGETGYFNQNGESVRKGLLRTPIDGARLSSGFGERKHPVLGYTRMHRGVDFAAPTGTPIYAAGNGVIVTAGRNHGYGNYIEIRHDADFHTAYGHLSRFAAGIHSGSRVKQGEVIGFVGATGLATGPHLHYEVIRDNDKVNPLSVKLPSGLKLHGKELDEFAVAKAKVDTMLARLPNESKVASNE